MSSREFYCTCILFCSTHIYLDAHIEVSCFVPFRLDHEFFQYAIDSIFLAFFFCYNFAKILGIFLLVNCEPRKNNFVRTEK